MSCAKYCTHKYEGSSTHRAWNALLTLKSHTATYTIYNHVLSLVKQYLWNVLRVRKDQSDHQISSSLLEEAEACSLFNRQKAVRQPMRLMTWRIPRRSRVRCVARTSGEKYCRKMLVSCGQVSNDITKSFVGREQYAPMAPL